MRARRGRERMKLPQERTGRARMGALPKLHCPRCGLFLGLRERDGTVWYPDTNMVVPSLLPFCPRCGPDHGPIDLAQLSR
jgi:ribosomal protein S27AE